MFINIMRTLINYMEDNRQSLIEVLHKEYLADKYESTFTYNDLSNIEDKRFIDILVTEYNEMNISNYAEPEECLYNYINMSLLNILRTS